MKLELVLEELNSFEKNSFLKIINDIVANSPRNSEEIDKILSGDINRGLKDVDSIIVAKVFSLIEDEFVEHVKQEFVNTSSQLDILTDIIIRDGNCIMKTDWFSRLYEQELTGIEKSVKQLAKSLDNADDLRGRDYRTYKACLETAYLNDDDNNLERKITQDELSILLTLSNKLELSQEEVKLINYMIVPIERQDVDAVITDLKNVGVAFYSKKQSTVYIADEIVRVLRRVRGKDVADKFFRRVLRGLREPQINLVCRKHNIDWKQSLESKIASIIKEGVSLRTLLINDVHKEGVTLTEKKKFLNEFFDKTLGITPSLKGTTAEEKVDNLIHYFEGVEKDEKVDISVEGYEKLLLDLGESLPTVNSKVREEFQLQTESVLQSEFLLNFNIKPRDVLELLSKEELAQFCELREIKSRGDLVQNVLDGYKDSENLYLENYENIAYRNLSSLKDNGIRVKESELGVKFEELTKEIFSKLGFTVDEKLRTTINTKKDKIDILLNLGGGDLILVECKTSKESGYNKFSSVSRQLRSYADLARSNDFKVIKSLLVAPEFTDEFINDCELEYELNLSLITASSLYRILEGFKASKHKELPYKLLMRDVLIQEDRILKALKK